MTAKTFLFFCFIYYTFLIVCDPPVGTPPLKPLGKGLGIVTGRVSWNFNQKITTWDGKTDFYWYNKYTNQDLLDKSFEKTIVNLANKSDITSAWDSLFRYFNVRKFGKNVGYKAGEKIAIKMNMNGNENYETGTRQNSITPQFVKSFLKSIVDFGKVPQEDITLFDASRLFAEMYWKKPEGIEEIFPNVHIVDSTAGKEYVTNAAIPDKNTNLHFSDPSVPLKDSTLLPKCLNDAKYFIEMNAFRGHSLAAMTETGKNFFGSIYRTDYDCNMPEEGKTPAYWCPISLHQFVNITGIHARGPQLPQRPMGVYNPLVDLIGCDDTVGKGLLILTGSVFLPISLKKDGTYGGGCQFGTCIPLKFQITPFNNHWSSSIFASVDPIAMDSVLLDFLRNEPSQKYVSGCSDNYLHEAALANDPPSKTHYAPSGKQLESLGVHEHWNSVDKKEYSKNLGIGNGIELVKVHELL